MLRNAAQETGLSARATTKPKVLKQPRWCLPCRAAIPGGIGPLAACAGMVSHACHRDLPGRPGVGQAPCPAWTAPGGAM